MQIGLVGLGRMGANMSRRWLRADQFVVGRARHAETVNGLLADGAISAGARSVDGMVGQLATLTTALYEGFTSRGEADVADRVLAAMRFGCGGHEETNG